MTDDDLPPLPKASPEQDALWDHVYEYGHMAEGVHERLERVCHAYARTARAPLLEYRNALDDDLVLIGATVDSFASAKEALRFVVDWHVLFALYPAVSSDAHNLIEDARAPLLKYRDALDDELVTLGTTVDSYASPKEALRAAIDWNVLVALDPAVSSDAHKLIEDARAPLLAEIERLKGVIEEVRAHAKYVADAEWASSARRVQARETLNILNRAEREQGDNRG